MLDTFSLNLIESKSIQQLDVFTYIPYFKDINEENLFFDCLNFNALNNSINNLYVFSRSRKTKKISRYLKKYPKIHFIKINSIEYISSILNYIKSTYGSKNSVVSIISPFSESTSNIKNIKTFDLKIKTKALIDSEDKKIFSISFHTSNINLISEHLITNNFKSISNKLSYFNCSDLFLYKNYLKHSSSIMTLRERMRIKNLSDKNIHELIEYKYKNNNNLCLSFLFCSKEIKNLKAFICFKNFLKNFSSKFKVDIFVFTDKYEKNLELLRNFEKSPRINSLKIIDLKIKKSESLYIKNSKDRKHRRCPELGFSSGPNLLFFESCNYLKTHCHHKNFLVIESDCSPTSGEWFDYIDQESRQKKFLILGSQYKGNRIFYKNSFYGEYLNGVAVYKNNTELHNLLQKTRTYIKYCISKKSFNKFLNYDTAICHYLKNLHPEKYNKILKNSKYIINCNLQSDSKYNISSFLEKHKDSKIIHHKLSNLKFEYNNSLAIFFPCTSHEFNSGKLEITMDCYFNNLCPSINYSFDLFFIFNNTLGIDFEKFSKKYKDHPNINSITIHSLDLKSIEDAFYRPWDPNFKMPNKMPPLGLSSGPNISFYNSLQWLSRRYKHYKSFFLCEEDSMPVQNLWFDKMIEIQESKPFFIAGSKYKGNNKYHKTAFYKDHLNGIAFYYNSLSCRKLLYLSKNFLKRKFSKQNIDAYKEIEASPMNFFIHYDIGIDMFLKKFPDLDLFFRPNLLDIDEVTNFSDPYDLKVPLSNIIKKYPKTLILHKKKVSDKELYKQIYKNEFNLK